MREQNNLDPALLAAVIYQESKFDTGARSSSGAIGLMQLTPATARGIAIRTGGSAFRTADLYNPEINIRYGAWYLENLFLKYRNERLVLAAYNAGQGNVDRWRAKHEPIQFAETRAYVSRVEHLKTHLSPRLGKAARAARMIDDRILELAENANTYTPLGASDERIVTDRYVLWMGRGDEPGWNVAQRFRLRADELAEVRGEIHRILRERGRTACSWEVGSSATPDDLVERLLRSGPRRRRARPARDRDGAHGAARRARRPPTSRFAGCARLPSASRRSGSPRSAFGAPAPTTCRRAAARSRRPQRRLPRVRRRRAGRRAPRRRSRSYGVTLFGGATLPEARGRGAYRALVAARWEDAVARGTPVLVTQAGAMSRSILARLGFREVCTIRILLDLFDRLGGTIGPCVSRPRRITRSAP